MTALLRSLASASKRHLGGSAQRTAIAAVTVGVAVGLCVTAGCSSLAVPKDPFSDRLDPDTATTVTVLADPVELISDASHATIGDPFAYVAPFETDRMGERALYLWVSAPQNNGPLSEPTLLCDGHALELQAIGADLTQFKLSRAPYTLPAPWSGQWYFHLPQGSLGCLGTVQGLELQAQTSQGETEHFTATGKVLGPLKAFAHR